MDLRRGGWLVVLYVLKLSAQVVVLANVVFQVQHKFGGRQRSSLMSMKAHDAVRHGRMLASLDLPLGGNGSPTDAALYFTKLGIGTPSNDYYVQVDTGSDILWVNCAGCDKCPKKSNIGIELSLYDPKGSTTGTLVTCDQEFCTLSFNAPYADCKTGRPCEYALTYGDGSQTGGYFVTDNIKFERVSGNLQTTSMNGTIAFGCSDKQAGELGSSSEAVDGILGLGQANSSMISQLASAGKVKKMFAHCLDNNNGGGIFAIGQVVQPQVKSTPMVPNQAHYNVNMKAIEVGGSILDLPKDIFDAGSNRGTIIDSGTTLAYLPDEVYKPLMTQVMVQQPNLQTHIVEQQFKCILYSGNVDDGFPVVTFHFENSVPLVVYPHEYLFQVRDDEWCFGWQNSGMQTKDGKEMTLLGDLVLSDKLVLYDLENQTIGWTNYNCSSSVKVKDEQTGHVYSVGAHNISSACHPRTGATCIFLFLVSILCILI